MTTDNGQRPRFDAPFLKAVLTRLILEPHFVVKFRRYLKPDYFKHADEHGALGTVARVWFSHISDGETNANFDSLYGWLQMQPDGDVRAQSIEACESLRFDKENVAKAKSDHLFQTFLQWLKSTAFLRDYTDVRDAFNLGRYDDAYETLEQSLGRIKAISLDGTESADWDNAANFLQMEAMKTSNKFEFGIKDFDETSGFEEATLNLFVAGTNAGKTQLSVHFISECVKQGRSGYFVFVEDRKTTILRRVYANLLDVSMDDLKSPLGLSKEKQEEFRKITEKLKKYIVVEFMYGVSPDFVLERAKEVMAQRRANGQPDIEVMLVDYLQHIASFSPGEKAYEKLAHAMARFKDFVLQYKLTGFTHQQVNRSGVQEQNKDNLITLGELSTSFNAAFVCDTIISLNRSPEQKEREEAVFYVLKGREGAAERRYQVKTRFSHAQYLMGDFYRLDAMKS